MRRLEAARVVARMIVACLITVIVLSNLAVARLGGAASRTVHCALQPDASADATNAVLLRTPCLNSAHNSSQYVATAKVYDCVKITAVCKMRLGREGQIKVAQVHYVCIPRHRDVTSQCVLQSHPACA